MGGFWVRSDLDFRKKVRVFNWGVFWVRSDFESRKKVIEFSIFRWGVFWVRSDLESRKKVRVFNWGGVLGKVRLGLWENFILGGVFWNQILEQGVLGNLVKNFWKLSLLVHHR